jgi:hypothetical protein
VHHRQRNAVPHPQSAYLVQREAERARGRMNTSRRTSAAKSFSLCPLSTACPEVLITDEGVVNIGEDANTARLSRNAWNELVRLIQQGELHEI